MKGASGCAAYTVEIAPRTRPAIVRSIFWVMLMVLPLSTALRHHDGRGLGEIAEHQTHGTLEALDLLEPRLGRLDPLEQRAVQPHHFVVVRTHHAGGRVGRARRGEGLLAVPGDDAAEDERDRHDDDERLRLEGDRVLGARELREHQSVTRRSTSAAATAPAPHAHGFVHQAAAPPLTAAVADVCTSGLETDPKS